MNSLNIVNTYMYIEQKIINIHQLVCWKIIVNSYEYINDKKRRLDFKIYRNKKKKKQ